MVGKVASLAHELRDDAMETRALVAKPRLSSAKLTEVFSSLGNVVAIQPKNKATSVFIPDGDVKVDLVGDWARGSCGSHGADSSSVGTRGGECSVQDWCERAMGDESRGGCASTGHGHGWPGASTGDGAGGGGGHAHSAFDNLTSAILHVWGR